MAHPPMFTEACLGTTFARTDRREALVGPCHVPQAFHRPARRQGSPFSLCNDPHYWHADYSTAEKPRHLLIC